jgi:hypothetical protein
MLRARSLLLALFCLLFVASWPGAAARPIALELTAAPIPKEIRERDGVLDVVVHAKTGDAKTGGAPDAADAGDPNAPAAPPAPAGPPIEGARVRAFAMLDGRAHAAGEATTDASGRATLRDLPRAEHWIVAEAPGRARASRMVVVVPGARRLDLELGPEHALDVEVRSEQGAPIAGAEIEARGSDPFPVGGRTGADGRAHVGRLGEAPWSVTVRAQGYAEVVRRRVPEGERLVVTVARQGALVVRVVDEGGAPAPGARVLVASPQLWPARVTETGEDGAVRIGNLDPGTYTLRSVHHTLVSPLEVAVALAKGEEKHVELRLAPGVMIAAHVVDAASRDDVPGARVTLAEDGLSPFPIEAVTDKKGRAVLGPIGQGGASLSASADGFVPKSAVRVGEPAAAGGAGAGSAGSGASNDVEIALVKGGALVGKVVDRRGWAVDGATIRVVGTDLDGMPVDEDPERASFRDAHFAATLGGPAPLVPAGELGVMPGPVPPIPHGPSASLGPFALGPGGALAAGPTSSSAARSREVEPWITGRDGTFRAEPIPPGRVRVLVTHPQYVEAMSELVSLAEGADAKVPDVVLSRGGSLEGRVADARGRAIGGAQITILATRGSLERTTRTGTDGSFAFAAVPESLTVLVSRDEDLAQVASRLEVTVPEGGKKTLEVTLADPREGLAVKVTGDRGSPVEAAQISAASLDAGEALRATVFTDKNGEATIPGGKGLALRVEVRSPGRAARVLVTTKETPSLDVELATAETVTGEVWANRREAIAGAEITLQTETGVRHARTGADGAFTIRDASPGPAHLRIRAKGRAPLARDVVVDARAGSRPTELGRFELGEEAIVDGVVLDARGDPVPGARVARDRVPTYLPVGARPAGMAIADARGHFTLGELPDGDVTLEAYAPDLGRAQTKLHVLGGRTTEDARIVLSKSDPGAAGGGHGGGASTEPLASGGVAITLGETSAGLEEREVVVVAVSEGSEAERAGLAPGDALVEVGGVRPRSVSDARARLSGPVHDDVIVKVRRSERVLTLRVAREAVRR